MIGLSFNVRVRIRIGDYLGDILNYHYWCLKNLNEAAFSCCLTY